MKRLLVLVLAAGIIAGGSYVNSIKINADTVPTVQSYSTQGENLIKNGDFSQGITGWDTYLEGGDAELTCDNGALKTTINDCGKLSYAVQVSKHNFPLYKGGKYAVTFDISSSINREVYYCIQLNSGDYHSYVGDQIKISPDKKTITAEFTMTDDTDLAPSFAFNMGNVTDEQLGKHTVTIDNVGVYLIDGSNIEKEDGKNETPIVLNQVGYLPNDFKKVVFRGDNVKDKSFDVVNTETNQVVYTGSISGGKYNTTGKETDYFGDFSTVTEPGTYKITTSNLGESYEFKIGQDVYKDVLKDAMRFFYMQRCGEELPEQYAGKWAHPICHTGLAKIYGTNKMIDVSGGWHDAGDYGRYVVASSKTIADLLLAYQADKAVFGDDTNIPESGNGIPDILDEVKGQLKWMFKMQNKDNGGVYHKVTCANFPGNVMPQEETDQLIVCPETTTASGDFAAVMAMGYEAFKDIDSSFANQCLEAAKKAWAYLDAQPSSIIKNPAGIVTGEYGDTSDRDERYWAAAQLFKATGESKYNDKLKQYVNEKVEMGYDWSTVGNYGNEAYLSAAGTDSNTVSKIKQAIIKEADRIVSASKNDCYSVSNGVDYYWGSNMAILNESNLLEVANKLSANPEYIEYAKEHLNYCFGKNANAISFVTGYGTVSPKNPHHRPSIAAKAAIPGALVGGVNSFLEDDYAEAYLADAAPSKCYLDNAGSYSTNEVDIYWNSTLVHALAKLNMVKDDSQSGNPDTPVNPDQPVNPDEPDKPIIPDTPEESDADINVAVETKMKNGVNQNYTITCNQDQAIDLSKLVIRSYYNKEDSKDMAFHIYNVSANINKAPWYVDFTSSVTGTFGHDEKGNYVEVKLNKQFELEKNGGSVKLQTCIANSDWSAISGFKDNGTVVLYDGKIVK